jgi:hypothetical protein
LPFVIGIREPILIAKGIQVTIALMNT